MLLNPKTFFVPVGVKLHGTSNQFPRFRTEDDRNAIGPVCFPDGWRWWVHDVNTGKDVGNSNGYEDVQEAFRGRIGELTCRNDTRSANRNDAAAVRG
jgi:hypothetical protein